MSYLDRPPPPKGPPWAHNSLGASVHNALAGWWRLPLAQRTVAAAGTLVDRGWINEGFADETQSVRQRERAISMVEGYVAGLDPADEPLGVERTVATRTDKIAVSGRIDRLDARPELVVVDYKTGRHLLTTDDARSSLALALYALAAGRVLRRPCRRVELHHLPTGEIIAWSHTEESLARHLSRAEDIAEECAPPPTSGCATACPPTATTRRSRPAPARPAPGATTGGTARKAPKPPRPAAPGTASPPTDPILRQLPRSPASADRWWCCCAPSTAAVTARCVAAVRSSGVDAAFMSLVRRESGIHVL